MVHADAAARAQAKAMLLWCGVPEAEADAFLELCSSVQEADPVKGETTEVVAFGGAKTGRGVEPGRS